MDIKLSQETIEFQAAEYRKLIRQIDDMASRLNIHECGTSKKLAKLGEKIDMYAEAEEGLLTYIYDHSTEDYPDLSDEEAEQELAGDIVRLAEDFPVAPISDLITRVVEKFYKPSDWYDGRL